MAAPRTGNKNSTRRAERNSPGPWSKWTETDRAERAIRFIETYIKTNKGFTAGQNIRLAEYQKEWLREVYKPGIRSAVMSLPRGNGKSTFLAAVAVHALFDPDAGGAPQIPIIATTVGQATRSVYGVMVAMVESAPELKRRSIIYSGIGTTKIYVPYNGGTAFPIANTIDGLQGLDPSLAVLDEVGFNDVEVYNAVQLASGKRPKSLVIGIGTPGFDRTSALWHIRALVRSGAETPGLLYTEYSAPAGCDLLDEQAWLDANPAIAEGFLDIDSLRTAVALSTEAEFRIFRLGQWIDGVMSWLGADGRLVWESLEDKYDLVQGAPTYVGIDVGIKRDSTAVVAVQFREDGRLHAKNKLWVPTKDEPVDVTDVMHYIRQLSDNYDLKAVSFDPRFFDVPAKMLFDEGIPMVEVPQSVERMTSIVGNAYQLVRSGGISHDGDVPFGEQVLNAVPRYNERGMTLQKSKSKGRIDAAVAMCLAIDRATWREAPRPPVVVL